MRALEKRHAKEREIDRAKISSLEAYVEKIHAEFTKNKQLMQMLVNKVEADQRLIEQANDLRMSISQQLSSNKESKGCQTISDAHYAVQQMTAATDAAHANISISENSKSEAATVV